MKELSDNYGIKERQQEGMKMNMNTNLMRSLHNSISQVNVDNDQVIFFLIVILITKSGRGFYSCGGKTMGIRKIKTIACSKILTFRSG